MNDDLAPLIFGFWSSLTDFAVDAGVSYGTAKQMHRRNSIPVRYWPSLIRNGRERGFEIDEGKLLALFAPDHAESPSMKESTA